MEKTLQGRRALITGGSSGIGRAVALAYAKAGADVAICATNPEKLAKVEAELKEFGGRVLALVCDVGDPEQAEETVRRTEEAFGGIDILCNIAGIGFCRNNNNQIRRKNFILWSTFAGGRILDRLHCFKVI